jgi:hypothetical protein
VIRRAWKKGSTVGGLQRALKPRREKERDGEVGGVQSGGQNGGAKGAPVWVDNAWGSRLPNASGRGAE